ncbi:hypothetical protein ACFL59_15480, partial [Planctomycetota bacterium]
EAAEPLLEDVKPEAELTIKGTSDVRFSRSARFYGQELAAIYRAELELEICDAEGNTLTTLHDEDVRGRSRGRTKKENRKLARECVTTRIGLFGAVAVLASQPIQDRLTDKGRETVKVFVDRMIRQREMKEDE